MLPEGYVHKCDKFFCKLKLDSQVILNLSQTSNLHFKIKESNPYPCDGYFVKKIKSEGHLKFFICLMDKLANWNCADLHFSTLELHLTAATFNTTKANNKNTITK